MRRPELTTAQLLVLRSFASVSIMLAIMNLKTKHYMFDTIPKGQILILITRVCLGLFNMFCQYYTIKYFPLVIVSLMQNMAPLLVALTSFLLYKLPLSRMDTSVLLVCFIGVILIVTGNAAKSKDLDMSTEDMAEAAAKMIIPSVLLVMMPINECSI
jgi:drug/metabolite transporter (DMT)-like permease